MKNNYKIIFLLIMNAAFSIHNSFSQTAPGIEWQKCLGGASYDEAYSIKQTNDGGFIIAGYTWSNNGDVTGNHGNRDYWVVKIDSAGTLQWQKCYGGTGADHAYSIEQTIDGGYIVAGITGSDNGDVTGHHDYDDTWVVKIDSAGILQWQKCLGGTDWEESYSVQQTSDGGYIVAGVTGSNDGDVTGNHGILDYWVLKLDSSGILQWQKCLGGTDLEKAYSVQQTSDGGFIVAGSSESNDGDVSGNHGSADFWIVKLNSVATIQWQKCLGGTGADFAQSIQQLSDGGYIVAGITHSNDGDVTGFNGYNDYWIVKIDSSGNLQWQKCLGGTYWDEAYSIQQTMDGGFIVGGMSESNDGDVSGNHSPAADYWIVKLFPDTITGISQLPQLPNYPITISPNPLTTQSKLTFKNPNKEKFLFTLYDITGRVTESVSTNNSEIILTKGSKPAGVYLFNLINEKTGERWNGKIIIAN